MLESCPILNKRYESYLYSLNNQANIVKAVIILFSVELFIDFNNDNKNSSSIKEGWIIW